jgi:DNA repair exonuclease SbcCD nuclease subunit
MTKLLVLNDLHLGVQRMGGTTPASAEELRAYTQGMFHILLNRGTHVAINGDMFDTHQVPTSELLNAYLTVTEWLLRRGEKLHLIPGNHDLSKNSANLSSFELMARLLASQFPDKVSYLAGGNWVDRDQGIYAISHVPNQDQFDVQLGTVPEEVRVLLLHCNYDNAFAAQAEHSLNLSRDQAKVLTKRGITLVLGHEHQHRVMMNDKVIIVGNQFPTSVSDCLGSGDKKYALEIAGYDMELIPTWSASDKEGFKQIDWDVLGTGDPVVAGFVRVTGVATAAQSADVIKAISKYRQASDHFVVTNAVKVEGVQDMDTLAESVEDIRSVNVIDLLLAELSAEQQVVVRKLLESV